jgi:hypothetical protein
VHFNVFVFSTAHHIGTNNNKQQQEKTEKRSNNVNHRYQTRPNNHQPTNIEIKPTIKQKVYQKGLPKRTTKKDHQKGPPKRTTKKDHQKGPPIITTNHYNQSLQPIISGNHPFQEKRTYLKALTSWVAFSFISATRMQQRRSKAWASTWLNLFKWSNTAVQRERIVEVVEQERSRVEELEISSVGD